MGGCACGWTNASVEHDTLSALLEVFASRGPARPAVNGEASGCPAQAPGRHSRKSWSPQAAGVADAQLTKFDLIFAPGVRFGRV
jgi:hypothetical protein